MKPLLLRKLMKWMCLLAVVYGFLVCALLLVMYQPPQVFGRIMSKVPDVAFLALPFRQLWFVARRGSLNVGDLAPDFTLEAVDRRSRVQLSSFRGREPVVLVFGSYT